MKKNFIMLTVVMAILVAMFTSCTIKNVEHVAPDGYAVVGNGSEMGDWSPGSAKSLTESNGLLVYTATATANPWRFHIIKGPASNWPDDRIGPAGDVAEELTLGVPGSMSYTDGGAGNWEFNCTLGTSYTVTLDTFWRTIQID